MSLFNSELGFQRLSELIKTKDVKVHFIGICGAGMAPLAELLWHRGISVSGSDRHLSSSAERLRLLGIPVCEGHRDTLDAGLAVYTLALSEDNPELVYAKKQGIPLVSRAELLGAVMGDYTHRIGVSGTHGKSTVTAMLHTVFDVAGLCPTVLSGSELASGGALRVGGSDYFIYEACEYRDSFLCFRPTSAVVTNVELDHTDYFPDYTAVLRSFSASVASATDYVFLNSDDASLAELTSAAYASVRCIGKSPESDYRYEIVSQGSLGSEFSMYYRGAHLADLHIGAIGDANVTDAAIAAAVAHTYGIPVEAICKALSGFVGIGRRLERLGDLNGRALYYDYAHHPTEILNTVRTLRRLYGKCTVVFRPHTYSRTRSLFDGFVSSLAEADFSVILDVYAAREARIPGVSAESLAVAIGERAAYLDFESVLPYVLERTDGAVVLMGAGDIEGIKKIFEEYGK